MTCVLGRLLWAGNWIVESTGARIMKQRSGVTSITWIILGLDAVLFLVLPLIGVIELFLGDPPYPRPWAELFYLLYLWYLPFEYAFVSMGPITQLLVVLLTVGLVLGFTVVALLVVRGRQEGPLLLLLITSGAGMLQVFSLWFSPLISQEPDTFLPITRTLFVLIVAAIHVGYLLWQGKRRSGASVSSSLIRS